MKVIKYNSIKSLEAEVFWWLELRGHGIISEERALYEAKKLEQKMKVILECGSVEKYCLAKKLLPEYKLKIASLTIDLAKEYNSTRRNHLQTAIDSLSITAREMEKHFVETKRLLKKIALDVSVN